MTLAFQVRQLAGRSIVRTIRQPAHVFPALVIPLALLAVNAGGLEPATALPGFPTDSFLAFALAVPFVQGALFATMNAGTDFARDVQTGFLNRLALTPVRGVALIAGQVAGVVAAGVFQAVVYLSAGVAAGTEIESGPAGVLVILVLAAVIALGFGAVGAFLALRTGSAESVQGFFPLLFVFLIISSMNLPRNLIEHDWFRIAATVNPVSYLIEGIRSLVIDGWDAQALALGFAVSGALAVVALAAAAHALRGRLVRT